MTNLPNRGLLLDRLSQRLAVDRRAGHRTALVLLDLDDFKSVNQSLGRPGGDQYLRGVADLLMSLLRPGDGAAHLGSDEFAIIFAAVDDATTAVSLTEQIRAELAAGVKVGATTVSAAASLGVTISRSRTPPQCAGRRSGGQDRAGLRTAIAEDQFELRYQPVFPLRTGAALVEVEALIRWQHPSSAG